MPNLAMIEEIASNTAPRTVTLSGMSVTVLFSCLDAANRLYDWQGADGTLSPAEIDQIEAILGDARHELMQSQIGEIRAFATGAPPAGSLLCDGTIYDRVDYPELYDALSPVFIVDADLFHVPDLRARFIYGAADPTDNGTTGGEERVTLVDGEMPTHSHSIGGAGTSVAAPGAVPVLTPSIFPGSTGAAGGGGSHNNMPPYMLMAFYITAV